MKGDEFNEVSVPVAVLALLWEGFQLAGDGGIDPFDTDQRQRVENYIVALPPGIKETL